MIEFATSETETAEYARFEIEVVNGTSLGQYDLNTNRYIVVEKELQNLYTSAGFTWNAVTVAKIYCSVIDGGVPSTDYYVALDAVRLENVSTLNPLYGLTGYSVIKNTNGETIIKSPNTNNYVEFRFIIDVGSGITS